MEKEIVEIKANGAEVILCLHFNNNGDVGLECVFLNPVNGPSGMPLFDRETALSNYERDMIGCSSFIFHDTNNPTILNMLRNVNGGSELIEGIGRNNLLGCMTDYSFRHWMCAVIMGEADLGVITVDRVPPLID